MNEHDVADAVESLVNRFPPRHLSPSDPTAFVRYVREYLEDLDDLPPELVVGAIKQLRRTSTFMPSVGEIRALIASAVTTETSPGEAWHIVKKQINALGIGRYSEWTFDDPAIADAVRMAGYRELCLGEEKWARQDFEKALKTAQERRRRGVQNGTAALGAGTVAALDRGAA